MLFAAVLMIAMLLVRSVPVPDKVKTLVIEEEDVRRLDPDGASFFNMNTPADYAEAQARWRAAPVAGTP